MRAEQVFAHNDVVSLEAVLRRAIAEGQPRTRRPWRKIVVVVEGIYSMEGEAAALAGIVAVKKKYKVGGGGCPSWGKQAEGVRCRARRGWRKVVVVVRGSTQLGRRPAHKPHLCQKRAWIAMAGRYTLPVHQALMPFFCVGIATGMTVVPAGLSMQEVPCVTQCSQPPWMTHIVKERWWAWWPGCSVAHTGEGLINWGCVHCRHICTWTRRTA